MHILTPKVTLMQNLAVSLIFPVFIPPTVPAVLNCLKMVQIGIFVAAITLLVEYQASEAQGLTGFKGVNTNMRYDAVP